MDGEGDESDTGDSGGDLCVELIEGVGFCDDLIESVCERLALKRFRFFVGCESSPLLSCFSPGFRNCHFPSTL